MSQPTNIRRAFILYSLVVVIGSVAYFFKDVVSGYDYATGTHYASELSRHEWKLNDCFKQVLGDAYNSTYNECKVAAKQECYKRGMGGGGLLGAPPCDEVKYDAPDLFPCIAKSHPDASKCYVIAPYPAASDLKDNLYRFGMSSFSGPLWTGLLSILLGVAAFPLFFVLKRWLFSGSKNKNLGE